MLQRTVFIVYNRINQRKEPYINSLCHNGVVHFPDSGFYLQSFDPDTDNRHSVQIYYAVWIYLRWHVLFTRGQWEVINTCCAVRRYLRCYYLVVSDASRWPIRMYNANKISNLNCLVKSLHVPLRSEFVQNLHLGEQHFKVLGIIMGIFLYLHFKIFRLASLARYYIL